MVLSSKNLFRAQLTQDFGAHSLPAGLLHKNQFIHHTPSTLNTDYHISHTIAIE